MLIRIATALVLSIGVFIAPWWIVGIGMLLCLIVYRRFVEVLVPAVCMDVLYGSHALSGIPVKITGAAIIVLVLLIVSERYFRNNVRL